ncbi:hypothetical protein CJ030_MR2G009204 [Morella rubra]|uniref:EF-hand domain-containing protein n=1 Tax=Morella rubra TaxID=262757 RepID=A0A6A1WF56_9ROSI|nr:hypothetical protein CJ030_MR2G009204 [Morella rubra]
MKDEELPQLSFSCITIATNNFSEENKLGEGGFRPVYKVDKDADGRITKLEITEIICLSASANHLSNIQKQAEEYAALIMEELDPDNFGYIMVNNLQHDLMVKLGEQSLLDQRSFVLEEFMIFEVYRYCC